MSSCRTCGKEEIRPHYHDDPQHALNLRYGRFVAETERSWIRDLLERAKAEWPSDRRSEDPLIDE